tara:strand:+ start:15573 stop:16289 length:717 start_codon:yes stop_codon:yes gene_type:complete
MSAEIHFVQFAGEELEFELIRRARKTLEIAVEPDFRVVVAAPKLVDLETIKRKVLKRAAWIRRQRQYFRQYLPRTPEKQFVGGETHLYLGRQYRLKITLSEQTSVKLIRGFIIIETSNPGDPQTTKRLLDKWYLQRAKLKFPERLEICLSQFPKRDAFRPDNLSIRKLRQRWGSMSNERCLILNRRLIEAPTDSIDYVITHELCHIAEANHGPDFFSLLTKTMPDWQKRKSKLERILA